ncbi:hypothetical protein N5F23_01450 [Pseudomonas sichuanensis]|uniref:hypothetical protein n=1 Tax=Pseudomonas sichuanensis TaxID=2213015 RepID=UPI00244B6512|nr:hypothetical protein [Pseudomonas sichuanensis]MDH0730156.1 hypothetical protein [Pseudomonas sichuanensis]MDH1581260.1 hypothetical protein [Pseudomonas sichuanensis]MDH1593421.1 hypothetical protein [Pseudomonas sichuanensis]MDH1597176.1 hypothetical protein [Pseudomonas sichuanensis]
MNTFQFLLFRGKHELSICIDSEEDLSAFKLDLSLCFATSVNPVDNQISISCRQRSSPSLRDRIGVFIDLYKEVEPKIHRVRSFIEKIPDGEHFFFIPGIQYLSSDAKLYAVVELMALDEGQDPDKALEAFKDNLGPFFENFEIDGRISDKKTSIGEPLKKNRVCRFCGNTRPMPNSHSAQEVQTTFKQEAHAISEALGNKTIILNEECDACNKFFSENCERHIYTYLRCLGTLFKVKNKDNTVSSIKGKNFQITYLSEDRKKKLMEAGESPELLDSTDVGSICGKQLSPEMLQTISTLDFCISYTLDEGERAPAGSPPANLPLKFNEKLSLQEVYKALVKFALSVMETKNLKGFEKTIAWVSGDYQVTNLPKIAILHSYASFTRGAELTIYRRTSDDSQLPLAIGEFQFTFQKIVFIIPSFNDAEFSFVNETEYAKYWGFSFFKSVQGWSFQDFSDIEEKDFIFNMRFADLQSPRTENPMAPGEIGSEERS